MCATFFGHSVAAQRTCAALVEQLDAVNLTLFYVGANGLETARCGEASGQLRLLLACAFAELELAQTTVEAARTLRG